MKVVLPAVAQHGAARCSICLKQHKVNFQHLKPVSTTTQAVNCVFDDELSQPWIQPTTKYMQVPSNNKYPLQKQNSILL